MTVIRKELRAMLKWCLEQPGRFRIADAQKTFEVHRTSIGERLRRLESMGYLEREKVDQVYEYLRVINREAATVAANTESPTAHRDSQKFRPRKRKTGKFAGVSFIFAAAQQF